MEDKKKNKTFFVDPLHGEELVVVHGAHVFDLPVQTLVGDGWLKVCDHNVPGRRPEERGGDSQRNTLSTRTYTYLHHFYSVRHGP